MKINSTFKLIAFGFICTLLATSCVKEGPMGLSGHDGDDGANGAAGSDGQNGVDGNVSCLVCHSGDNMLQKQAQFVLSGHKVGKFTLEREEWSASCGRCHTPAGFIQFAEFGSDAIYGNIQNSETFDCNTCHGLHVTFESTDYALRTSGAVIPSYTGGPAMELGGNSNLCGQCHQARRAGPVDEDQFNRNGSVADVAGNGLYAITSSHYGPHHGAQANVVAGVGFAEIPGSVAYPEAGSAKHLNQASCVGCHMSEFNNTRDQGGHSFAPSVDACNTCHGVAESNFNYGGVQSSVHARLEELRDKLIALGVVAGDDEHGYHPVTGTFPIEHVEAFFNWIGLEEDRSLGVHNPKYVNALLINTLEALE